MKKLFFTLALATVGFFAQASTAPATHDAIELTSGMVLSENVVASAEAKEAIYLGVYDVYVDGVYIGTYHVYLIID